MASRRSCELFNLASDLGEKKNLAAEQPDKVRELRAKLDALMSTPVASGALADTTDDKRNRGKYKGKKQ